jgi:short-subunit dehydrogenase
VALVTGASSGIGREVAILLARRGYRLVLTARRAERLKELAAALPPDAVEAVLPCDLACAGELEALAARLSARGEGGVEVLVNNAGFGLYRPFLSHSTEDFRRLMEVHYFAAVSTIRAVLPGMVERRRGQVINIASIAIKMGPWGHAGYAASKSALATLTQTLAAEYRGTGVRFSYVNPGIVETEYFEHPSYESLKPRVRRHAVSAGYAARKIVSLLDHPRLELCIPAHYRVMDWFKALSPALTHLLVSRQSRPPRDGRSPSAGG